MKALNNKNGKMVKRMLILLAVLFVIVFILIKAEDFIKEQTNDKISLVINNTNVTERLKNELKIDDGIIYVSMDDMKNFFDKYIYVEDETNEVITTYDDKIASIGFESNKLTLNGSTKKTGAHAIKEDDITYLPISEMKDVYDIEIDNIAETKVITIDSVDREQIKAQTKTNISVKSKKEGFSRTVDKVEKGESVIVVKNNNEIS